MSNHLAQVIILEGPDGGGKSTLAAWLHTKHDYKIVKINAPRPEEDVFRTYTDTLLVATDSGERVVFDRHYIGEGVYGPLLRGGSKIGDQGRDLLERLIAARGVKVVICSPPWRELVKGWKSKEDLLKREAQLRQVQAGFLSEAKRLGIKPYDWACGDPETALVAPSTLPAGVTGYPGADTLWVGERPGKARLEWDLPFHCLTGSARYLWEALQGVKGWNERRGAWTNAFDVNGQRRDLTAIINALPKVRRVVALGSAAYRECMHRSFSSPMIRQVQHPQYWRRFHHHEMKIYIKNLEDAIR